jgi:hypothetical protein
LGSLGGGVEVVSLETPGVVGEEGDGPVGAGLSVVVEDDGAPSGAVLSPASAETGKSANASTPAKAAKRPAERERIGVGIEGEVMISCRAGS